MNFNDYSKYLVETLDKVDQYELDNFINLILKAYHEEKMIFVIGNGGSAANASHFAQDLAKGTRKSVETKKRIKALSLTDNTAFITALGNDDGYETVFEQQLRTYAQPGDYLIAISGSGNSPNILKAIQWANANGVVTVGITGFEGGKLKQIANHSVNVPLNDMCTSESVHSMILHYLILNLQSKFH